MGQTVADPSVLSALPAHCSLRFPFLRERIGESDVLGKSGLFLARLHCSVCFRTDLGFYAAINGLRSALVMQFVGLLLSISPAQRIS